ncbi:MAG TPA: hypothetical protein VJI75_00900 [Candidatus Nanoarchaeia archaeon]|nr:hypothetical protein [Candidatus Nanoarchaeia archaeon]
MLIARTISHAAGTAVQGNNALHHNTHSHKGNASCALHSLTLLDVLPLAFIMLAIAAAMQAVFRINFLEVIAIILAALMIATLTRRKDYACVMCKTQDNEKNCGR